MHANAHHTIQSSITLRAQCETGSTQRSKGDKVNIEKAIKSAVEDLAKAADDCFERAETEHKVADGHHKAADAHHAGAEKLVVIGQKLEADSANLAHEIEIAGDEASKA